MSHTQFINMNTIFLTFQTFLFISISVYSADFAKQNIQKVAAHGSAEYLSMTFNGAWCWYSDPRAVYFEGEHKRTYSGWIDNYGNIQIACYDHETQKIQTKVVYANLEIDDHDNPSILIDENGHLLVFFTTHVIDTKPIYMMRSSKPESIDVWEKVSELYLNDPALKSMGGMNHTYSHPVKLAAEKGRIYLFWRGVDGKPSFSHSDDNGVTWAIGKIFFMPEKLYSFRRPYTKIYSDGIDKIHITVTDGHPRKESENNIYYMYLKNGAFYKADDTKIKNFDQLPIKPDEADLVYNAKEGKAKAWNWDIAQDEKGNPVIAYAKFPNDSNHIYCYAQWSKKGWTNTDLITSGAWFPETPDGIEEAEPNYSGGMCIDFENTNILYLSVKRNAFFEIEKWQTNNAGKSWNIESITSGSSKNNVRPFAVRGAKEGNPLQLLWMQNTKYIHFGYAKRFLSMGGTFETRLHASIKCNMLSPAIENPLQKEGILKIMHQTANWQLANPFYKADYLKWHYEPLFKGMAALYELTGENRYKDELYYLGKARDWKPMDDVFNADRMAIVDTWCWLYSKNKEPQIIEKAQWALDIHIARGTDKTNVHYKDNTAKNEWWSWCDALFMAPSAFAHMSKVTGDPKYLDYMNTQWWKTSDYLYSKEDSLFYRDDRYFEKRTANGKKVFWGRGNGWVIAGLARTLSLMPKDYAGREKFEQQYREMAHKILSLQNKKDGLWRVSLYDNAFLDMGESSGSALFAYALAWGINNGLLDKSYQNQVEKAWLALCKNVNNEGRLGFVQQVAGDPFSFKKDEWHVYATGAFLMAGEQMIQLETKE